MKRKASILALVFFTVFFCIIATSCISGGSDRERYRFTCYKTPDSSPEYTTVYDDDTEFFIDDLQRFGYTFLGLYDSPSGGAQIVNEQGYINVKVDRDMTLYAQWRATPCQIVFNADGGTNSTPSMSATYGSPLAFLPIPEKTGFNFVGWADKNGNLCTDENGRLPEGKGTLTNDIFTFEDGIVNLTAVYETKKLTVTLNYNDGSYVTETLEVEYATVLDLTQLPQKDTGASLISSWSTSPMAEYEYTSPITENITLYAIWKDYKYFEFYEIGDETPTQIIKIFRGETVTPYTPERVGYEFDGWYIQAHFAGVPVNTITYGSGSTKYYAKWDTETYSVDFSVDGEYIGNTDSIEYNIETDVLLPTVTKENYTFLGWCKNQDLSDTPLNVLESGTYGDLTLYAKFKGDDRQVTLDAGEGYVKQSNVTLEYGAINTLPVPVISGMVFVGWALEDGTMLTDREGVLLDRYLMDGTVALTAQYKQKYFITVDVTHPAGKIETKEYYVEGDNVILKFEQTNFGYNFDGFFKDGELVSAAPAYGFVMPAENIELTVELTPKEFLVTFNLNGAFETASEQTLKYGESYTLPVVYKQGYIFEGWLLDGELITDSKGKSLNPCSLTENVTVMASFKEDTKNTITYIKTAEDFKKMYSSPKGTYVLLNDIDISNITIPSVTFTGVLEGNGYSITGISAPLFNNIEGNARVCNLTLSVHVTATSDSNFGAVARQLFHNAEVENIVVTGKINITTDCDLGGVIGKMNGNSIVIGCENRATITATNGVTYHAVGGIVSYMVGGSIIDCQNYGTITGKKFTGGIVGGIDANGSCQNCENYGKITGISYTGGIVGYVKNPQSCVSAMLNVGEIIGEEYTGGLVGGISCGIFGATYDGHQNFGKVTGTKYVGGLFGYLDAYSDLGYGNLTATFNILNFTNEGDVTGTSYVGGMFGYLKLNIDSRNAGWMILVAEGLENIGDISGTSNVGGLFGYAFTDHGDSSISNSYSSAKISADYLVGGLAGQLNRIKLIDSSNEGTTLSVNGYLIDGSNFQAYAGGYVGLGNYFSGLKNSTPITYDQRGNYIGGIAGYANSYIIDCENTADINAPNSSYVGGIIGSANCGAMSVKVQNNLNSGNITGADYTGGIIGHFKSYASIGYSGGTYFIEMNDLDNSGAVVGGKYVAGLVAYFHVNIDSNYEGWSQLIAVRLKNTGDVKATSYAGGLFGYAYSDNYGSSISESSSSATVNADYIVGGLAGELVAIGIFNSSNEGTLVIANSCMMNSYQENLACVGGYIGIGHYISGCNNSADIMYSDNGWYIGGVAGVIHGNIENCSNNGNITAEKASYVGGVLGYASWGNANFVIKNLSNTGNVSGKLYVGGVIGSVNSYASIGYANATYTITMSEVSNTGSIFGSNYAGGICGHVRLNIDSKYTAWARLVGDKIISTGDVSADSNAGGLFGCFSADGYSEISGFTFGGKVSATDGSASDTIAQMSNIDFID